jgi:hypothetical protein
MKRSAKPECADGMDTALGSDLLLPYCCQDPSNMIVGSSLFIGLQVKKRADERTRTAFLISSYECAVMCCRGVQGIANAAYLEGFPFPALLSVAPYCVPGGIRVVSMEA